jgi:PAS domain S-box-containing protein
MPQDSSVAQLQVSGLRDGEARLRLAVEEAGLATLDVDVSTGEALWSDSYFRLLGYPVSPTGRASYDMWSSRLHPEDRAGVFAALKRAERERALFRCEHRVVRASDGEVLWLEPRCRFLYDDAGKSTRLVGVCLEISARKQAEEALAKRETQLELAMRIVGLGIFDHDHVNNRLYWSGQMRDIHDVPPGVEPDLSLLQEHLHPDDRQSLQRAFEAAQDPNGPGTFGAEYRILRSNGEVRWIVGRAQTFFTGEGAQRHPERTVGAEIDVTERKRIEMDLRTADRRKDEFLATLSHELRNPLAPIRTAAQMLTMADLDREQLAWARQVIHRQVEHMARLLDDLLDVARITRGKLELRKERVDLGTIVDAAIESARPLITARRHGLTVDLSPQLPSLNADPVRLAQVLSNLLTNAAKYTDPPGRIALTARVVDDDMLRISVKDSGIGLSPAALAHIFQMFSQVEDAYSRSEGGLGIGLALVKGLVTLHGGSIEALSEGPGAGSEFVITLPIDRDVYGDDADVRPAPPGAVATPSMRRILVADDNQDAADSLAMLLQAAGHEVATAHGGETALSIASSFQPGVALLDIGMPDLDGYEVAKRIRSAPWGRDMHLIAVTGWGQEEDKRRALGAGFDYHLTKPIELHQLEKLLDECVSRS